MARSNARTVTALLLVGACGCGGDTGSPEDALAAEDWRGGVDRGAMAAPDSAALLDLGGRGDLPAVPDSSSSRDLRAPADLSAAVDLAPGRDLVAPPDLRGALDSAAPSDLAIARDLACAPGFADCDRDPGNGCEADLASDPRNCTGCGVACSIANGAGVCKGGCAIASCNPEFADCDRDVKNGCEASLREDRRNCGGCAIVCPQPMPCIAGRCAPAVLLGPMHRFNYLATDHYVTEGCCSVGCQGDQAADADYFCKHFYGPKCFAEPGWQAHTTPAADYPKLHKNGGCSNQGSDIPATTCDNGPCRIGRWSQVTRGLANLRCTCLVSFCAAPLADCNGNGADGCEADLARDPANCGVCGRTCAPVAHGRGTCVPVAAPAIGECAIRCDVGFGDCDQDPTNGCEAPLAGDDKNCGQCGTVCPGNQACVNGACK